MEAWILREPEPVEERPLQRAELPVPSPGPHDVLIRVSTCGVCHTDLHIVEGELPPHKQPVVPGHQIVGRVEAVGSEVTRFEVGDRVGVPWLNWADGECYYCRHGQENLCVRGLFTGYDVNGGYGEYQVTSEDFVYHLPEGLSDTETAPLLCAGVIGYRALRLSGAREARRLGLYGFGSSAHIAIQIARYWGVETYVFTRSEEHQQLARELGAAWAGRAEDEPGELMDASIIFAPAGQLVPRALEGLAPGGTVACAGIYMTPIPEFDYRLLWGERVLRSVANATREDAEELLRLAAEIPIRTEVEVYPLDEANEVLNKLARSEIRAAAVLDVGRR